MRHTARLWLLLFISISRLWADAGTEVNVLVLQSFHQNLPWPSSFQHGLIRSAEASASFHFNLFFEHLDTARLPSFDHSEFLRYINYKYAEIPIDFLITDSTPATEFVHQYSSELRWAARILYSPDKASHEPSVLLLSNNQNHFVERTINLMIEQMPDMEKLILVESAFNPSQQVLPVVARHMQRFPEIEFEVENNFLADKLFERVSQLSENTAVLYSTVFVDRKGDLVTPSYFAQQLTLHSSVPIYGLYSSLLGTGIVGGELLDAQTVATSSVNAMEDYLLTGSFGGYYPTSKSYVDVSIAKKYGLPVNGLNIPINKINEPLSWQQRYADRLLWGSITFAFAAVISLFWIIKLRMLNTKLAFFNEQLENTRSSLARANSELKRQSLLDPLTGLLNRRAMMPKISEAIEELRRYGIPSTIMLIDLDDFNVINDIYGHNVGDMVLRSYSQTLTLQSRRTDFLSRWGGEEFLILAKGITAIEAKAYLNNIRQRTLETQYIDDHRITFSAGVYELTMDYGTESAIDHTDQAMYQAKSNGKNCTVIFGQTL